VTEPYYRDDSVTVYAGDCLDVLAELPDNSVDAVVTDPPYGLDFMGKHWDTGAVAFDTTVWKHCLRILKPGGHLTAFGGTRTWHRLACAVEDAGFEIRDNIAWLYFSGFPKSMDVSKAIDKAAGAEREVVGRRTDGRYAYEFNGTANRPTGAAAGTDDAVRIGGFVSDKALVTTPATDDAKRWAGWGTALKPAFEPIILARKPVVGTVANNVIKHGTGGLNIDACRVPTEDKLGGGSTTKGQQMKDGWRRPWMDDPEVCAENAKRHRERVTQAEELGRWPANLLLDEGAAKELDVQSGNRPGMKRGTLNRGSTTGRSIGGDGTYDTAKPQSVTAGYGDEGGGSRMFPVFKYQPKAGNDERPTHNDTQHPTVKPLDLMRWLVRLVTPPGGTVLEPFAGSGTTAEAAIHEHMRCIAIEREADYLPLIVNRLTKPIEVGFNFA
jgi:DNA modification methylase